MGIAQRTILVKKTKEIVTMMVSVKKITSVELTTAEVCLVSILILTAVTMKMKIFAQFTILVQIKKEIVIQMKCAKRDSGVE